METASRNKNKDFSIDATMKLPIAVKRTAVAVQWVTQKILVVTATASKRKQQLTCNGDNSKQKQKNRDFSIDAIINQLQ